MRCAGTVRTASQVKQRTRSRPTARSKKRFTSLSLLDFQTYPIWLVSCLEPDSVRPSVAGHLPDFGDVVVAASYRLADGSEYDGALSVTLTRASLGFKGSVLLLPGRRVDLPDGWPQFDFGGVQATYKEMSDGLAERLRREFLQNLSRAARHIGKSLEDVFPIEFRTKAPLRGTELVAGVVPRPNFQVPIALGQAESLDDVLKVRGELELAGGRWVIAIASAHTDRSDLLTSILAKYGQWSQNRETPLKKLDLLLFAREPDSSHESLIQELAEKWNAAAKPAAQTLIDVWVGSEDRLWCGFTNHARGAQNAVGLVHVESIEGRR